MNHSDPALENTLPHLLNHQARVEASRIALRHKRLGIWCEWCWSDLAKETASVAAELAAFGFKENDRLVVLSYPRKAALVMILAAQSLGGSVIPFDPSEDSAFTTSAVAHLGPAWVFAEDEAQVDRVMSACSPQRIFFSERRGVDIASSTALTPYDTLLTRRKQPPELRAETGGLAFEFYRREADGDWVIHGLRHADLIGEARRVIQIEKLTAFEEALAARALATAGQARYLIAPWLLTGFTLNFPENIETRDLDRRELGPTLLVGTRQTFGRIAQLAFDRLPVPGSLSRRLIDAALSPTRRGLMRWLAEPLVRRPLRDVLGLTRTRTPLVVGEPLSPEAKALFESIGLKMRQWEDDVESRFADAPPEHSDTVSVSSANMQLA